MKCIVCDQREVNPNIGSGSDKPIGKSFCSRICYNLYMRTDFQFMPHSKMRELANKVHDELSRRNSS